jgi:hypothetical protein
LRFSNVKEECMKRVLTGITAALALALVGTAWADDLKTSDTKSTVKKDEATKVEKKAKKDTQEPAPGSTMKDTAPDPSGTATKQAKATEPAK